MSDFVRGAHALHLLEPVRLTGRELGGDDVPTEALRAAALAYAREHLQGRAAFNGPTGWAVAVGRRGINKTLNHGARREHVHTLLAALVLGEGAGAVAYRVRLIVKETNEGYRFYDHDLSAAAPAAGPSGPETQTEPAGPDPGGTPSRRRGDSGPAGGLRGGV